MDDDQELSITSTRDGSHRDMSNVTSADVERLAAEKLRLEILQLSLPWWKNPTNVAPLATISVALIGLIWATASGFFDSSRRELEARKKELEVETRAIVEKRDEQANALRREASAHELRAQEMESEITRLNMAIKDLDQPFVVGASASKSSSAIDAQTGWVLLLRGFNFGALEGRVSASLIPRCSDRSGLEFITLGWRPDVPNSLKAGVIDWSHDQVSAGVTHAAVQRELTSTIAGHKASNGGPFAPTYCDRIVQITVTRVDGRTSNRYEVELPEPSVPAP